MDNSIVTSAYNLTLNEQRLIYCALKQMPKYDPENPNHEPLDPRTPFYITRDDFIELGVDPSNVAQEIRQATRELMKKTLYVQTPVGIKQFHWLSEVLRFDRNAEQKLREKYPNPSDYDQYMNALRMYNLLDALPTHKPDDNIVARVIFSHEILPLLSDLKASFTQFLLSDVAEFGSIYSFRIYQFIMRYKDLGVAKINLDDLRYMLLLMDKYPLTADLKRWVLDVATKEINEKSPYKISYEMLKKGRKFVAVEFTFKPKVKKAKEKPKTLENKDPNTIDIFDNLTDKEREIVANKNAYADSIGATELHRQNLIKQALEQHRQAEQQAKDRADKERAENHAQEQQDKERLELAQRQFEQILNDDRLINAYIANNGINEKNLNGLQKLRFEQGDFKGVFEMEKYKFSELHYIQYLNLNFLNK
jgi:plasmid replication initiation protein